MRVFIAALVLLASIEFGNILAYSIAVGPTYDIPYYNYLKAHCINGLNI